MANKYWVGGNNTWDSTAGTKWATSSGGAGGAAVAGASDTAFFDAASGAVTVTVAANKICGVLNTSGFTGNFIGGPLVMQGSITTGWSIYPSHGYNITTIFNHTGGCNAYCNTSTCTVGGDIVKNATTGSLTLGGSGDLNCTGDLIVHGNTTTITMGQGRNFNFRNLVADGAVYWDIAYAGNITLSGDTCTIPAGNTFNVSVPGGTAPAIIMSSAGNKTFNGGGCNFGPLTLLWFAVGPSGSTTITGSNTGRFKATTYAGGGTLNLTAGSTQTLNGSLYNAWDILSSAGNIIAIASTVAGSQANLVSAQNVTCNYISLKDNWASGGGIFTPGLNSTILTNVQGWTLPVTAQPRAIIMA